MSNTNPFNLSTQASTLVRSIVERYSPADGMTKGEIIDFYINRCKEQMELTESELENLYQAFDHHVDELFNY